MMHDDRDHDDEADDDVFLRKAMERLIIVNRIDDAPATSRQWIEPAISKKTMMVMVMMMMGMGAVFNTLWPFFTKSGICLFQLVKCTPIAGHVAILMKRESCDIHKIY